MDPSPASSDEPRTAVERRIEALTEEIWERADRGPIPPEGLEELARKHNLPLSAVESRASFYTSEPPSTVRVCVGLPCALRATTELRETLDRQGVAFAAASCLGYCEHAPVALAQGKFYHDGGGRLTEIPESRPEHVEGQRERIEQYRVRGGYVTLRTLLAAPDPAVLLAAIERARLKGMGGAGFPAHVKWNSIRAAPNERRYLLVNAHEGEPATFKDRLLMERRPHLLLEGALLAARSVDADRILIGLRREYRNARASLESALHELEGYAREHDLSGNLPKIRVLSLAGAYITGEETALMEAIEGNRSEPRLRPPFPTEYGLFGRPTLIQNVETLCRLPGLLKEHPDGAGPPPIEKSFCVTGDVARPGAYEAPLGTPIAELLERAGVPDGAKLKAVLPGGLSGGILPAPDPTLALDYDAVRATGAGLGTGALVVIGGDRCIVGVLENVTEFFETESCGKCVPCRLGTAELAQTVRALRAGAATPDDLARAESILPVIRDASLCALGPAAAKAYADTMKHFRAELEGHLAHRCVAGECFRGGGT